MKKNYGLYQISLKLILKNSKGQILALNGLPHSSYAGLYDFPGGRIDKDEFTKPLMTILKREIKEEIGSVKYKLNSQPVAVGRHLSRSAISKLKKDVYILYVFFEGKYQSGQIKVSDEHPGYKWLDLKSENLAKYFISANLEGIKMYLTK